MQVHDALHTDINYFMTFILTDRIGERQKCWNREKKMGKKGNVEKPEPIQMATGLPLRDTGTGNERLHN